MTSPPATFSARRSSTPGQRGFDTFAPVGPCIAVGLETADLIAYISSIMTLLPGDIIFTGIPAGIGPPAARDMVTVTASGVGELANPVVQD